jgi:hypothetical protein
MANHIWRRDVLKAGFGVTTAAAGATMLGKPNSVFSAPPAQRDWRFCRKCQTMYFDGFPNKGRCAAGGSHEAAGFNFVLEHDQPERPNAQANWRYCGKCQSMFFNGSPNKGACAAGGGHAASGFNFVLPHDVAETPATQKNWRFCRKCQAMYFDGFPNKGRCAASGAHEAAGFNFVLRHALDYLARATQIWGNPAQMNRMFLELWQREGRQMAADEVTKALNGRELQRGFNIHRVNVNLGNPNLRWNIAGPGKVAVHITVPGSNAKFLVTTPTVFGSYADPAFRVGFDITADVTATVTNTEPPVRIGDVNAVISNASVHGANATGTVTETVADLFTKGRFSQEVTAKMNNSPDLRQKVAKAVRSALANMF